MSEKLKPCPFCGGKGSLDSICILETEYSVQCESCGASGGHADNKKEAIDAWNSRSDGTIDIAMLEAKLRKYADKKCDNGEIELANGILKAISFIKEEFKEE